MGMSKRQRKLKQTADLLVDILGKHKADVSGCLREIRKIDQRKRAQFRAARKRGLPDD